LTSCFLEGLKLSEVVNTVNSCLQIWEVLFIHCLWCFAVYVDF